ncbi:MAG: sarcosine oxidase subunit gamma SoxG [Thermodesulfobacteriota bacterium]|nr:sarcosine oxidase subunit gamma SoxG [Thermodesulfobacteriota bacterium]
MKEIYRESPVTFKKIPKRTETRDNWTIALEYEDEDKGQFLIDLSHRTRLDIQDSDFSSIEPFGIKIPDMPGMSVLENGFLINRMNRTQTSVWHLVGETPEIPDESAYTDVTESTLFLAIMGKTVFSIAEKLTSLDFLDSGKKVPFLLQGPFSHVPCQIVTLERDGETSGIIFTCSRGYGKTMVDAVMEAGAEFGLRPAGEDKFTSWVRALE